MDANFNTLFNRYIENQTTPEEEQELMRLIRDGANRFQMEQTLDSVLGEENEFTLSDADRQELRTILLNRIRPPRTRTLPVFWMAAACVLIASVVGIWLYK